HTRFSRDWSSDVCSSDLAFRAAVGRMEIELLALRDAVGTIRIVFEFVPGRRFPHREHLERAVYLVRRGEHQRRLVRALPDRLERSEERRVGKECRDLV